MAPRITEFKHSRPPQEIIDEVSEAFAKDDLISCTPYIYTRVIDEWRKSPVVSFRDLPRTKPIITNDEQSREEREYVERCNLGRTKQERELVLMEVGSSLNPQVSRFVVRRETAERVTTLLEGA